MAKKVAVVGAGVMGHGIAQAFASSGFMTALIDKSSQALERSLVRIRGNLKNLVELKVMGVREAESVMERITTTPRLPEGVAGAVFVQETVPEDLHLKRDIFEALGEVEGEAVLGSNAATIPIREIAAGMKARRRILGVHWVNPPYIVPAVEVIPSRWTAPDVVERTRELLKKAGKVPVVCKDIPGKIILRVQFAMMNEAIRLLEIGAASAEDIDNAVRLSTGLRLPIFGPLKFSDFHSTHRNTLNGMKFLYGATGDGKFKPSRLLREKVKRGHLGIWTGRGWYDYAEEYEELARWRDSILVKSVRALRRLGVVPS